MTPRPLSLLPLLLLLPACAGGGSGWWNVPTDVDPGASPLGDDDDDGDDGDDDDGESGSETILWGKGPASAGSFSGEGGFYVVDWNGDDDQERCSISWNWSTSQALTPCSACSMAFELTRSDVEVEVDEDGACAPAGTPAQMESTPMRLGVSGEELLAEVDGSWTQVGFAESEGDLLFFEYVVASSFEDDDDDGDDDDDDDDDGDDDDDDEGDDR